LAPLQNSSVIVELVGAPGVGKTHMVRRFFERAPPENWQSFDDLDAQVPRHSAPLFLLEEHKNLLELKLHFMLQEKFTPIDFSFLNALCLRHLRAEAYWRSTPKTPHILADEHLAMLFYSEISQYASIYKKPLAGLFQERALVLLSDSAENINARRMARLAEGLYFPQTAGQTEQEMYKQNFEALETCEATAAMFEAACCPVLRLNASDDLQQNLVLLAGFLSNVVAYYANQ
jgi:hypothetical protein